MIKYEVKSKTLNSCPVISGFCVIWRSGIQVCIRKSYENFNTERLSGFSGLAADLDYLADGTYAPQVVPHITAEEAAAADRVPPADVNESPARVRLFQLT